MKVIHTPLEGAFEIIPDVYEDERGFFFESFHQEKFKVATGLDINFVQDNESYSTHGVIRGLHYQKAPYEQAKLVRVVEGEALDVIVDIRKGSPNYGQHYSTILTGENKKQLFVPKGFAHGIAILTKVARFAYKCDEFYKPEFEEGIHYNDPHLNIDWLVKIEESNISSKDINLPFL